MNIKKDTFLKSKRQVAVVDLFCGAGGLTRGLIQAGLPVVAGYDVEAACRYAYEKNNQASFIQKSVSDLTVDELSNHYPEGAVRILVGCAPCQPFSKYTQSLRNDKISDSKWRLLYDFLRLVDGLKPEIVSMENVIEIQRHEVFHDFVISLEKLGYHVFYTEVYCPDYGIPQQRKRLVLLASLLDKLELIPADSDNRVTVREAIGELPHLEAGEVDQTDNLHRTSRLSDLNLDRIKLSRPGGNWRDWPEHFIAQCHMRSTGKTYPSVYGRMEWDKPSPTITTQFFGFGNGRFGHPEQNRALSLREGAILQSFPPNYEFVSENEKVSFSVLGKMIGNAVPVKLGEAIGKSILDHIDFAIKRECYE